MDTKNTHLKTRAYKHKKIFISIFWFLVGFFLTGFLILSFITILFQNHYADKAYPGIFVDNIYLGGKTGDEIKGIFDKKNASEIKNINFTFEYEGKIATVSAGQLNLGYDSKLIAKQAKMLGKGKSIFSNLYLIADSYLNGIYLPPAYALSRQTISKKLDFAQKDVFKAPEDAVFSVLNNRVIAFKESGDGKTIDFDELYKILKNIIPQIIQEGKTSITIIMPIKILKPKITTEKTNNLGVSEIISIGKSIFYHSIPNRVHNIALAASRLTGILIAPNEEFSFNETLGDISKYTGYKEGYIIKDGRTMLGDGGGVCQVSTTLFRALLSAGLPITERHAHSYRVGYYEQDSPPGFDATVFTPTDDLKFKNDTNNYILIQTAVDPENYHLQFTLYGKRDGREVKITKPAVSNESAPPPDLYQDDPTLDKGTLKQVDFEAWGATVKFKRTVIKKDGTIYNDTFISNYAPWQAVYLKGTKG